MEKRYNPLENWRGSLRFDTAASLLHLSPFEYWELEKYPWDSYVNSDQIIEISQVTHIPLEALIDYLAETETKTKEMA